MEVILKHITKTFAGTKALENVNLQLAGGEINCLVGENGAGKSTIIKVLAGAHMPDSGEIWIDGKLTVLRSPRESQFNKIAVIHQELLLVPEVSVAENIFLGDWPKGKHGLLDRKAMNEQASLILKRIGANINPTSIVSTLSTGEQQLVEIAKSLSKDIKVLILDEPTASLSEVDANNLLSIVTELKRQGIAILYVSHRLEEVFAIADKITVFRDGKYIDCVSNDGVTKDEIVKMMVGREAGNMDVRQRGNGKGRKALEVRHLTSEGLFRDINFELYEGEVLGLAGLVGAGRTEVLRALYGADRYDSGEVLVYGTKKKFRHPAEAIREGLSLVPEDRKTQGLVLGQSVEHNIQLGILKTISSYGLMKKKMGRSIAVTYQQKLRIKTASLEADVNELSGGNQQKVVLARSLVMNPKILLMDEPTRGVDVGAREEIHMLIDKAVKNHLAVLLVSSDILELLALSDRVVVMKEGTVAGTFEDDRVSKEEVIKLAAN